ncbi:MAG: hypothetical protein IH858_08735 [Chloroflexi bacterium]|nr:hypothetical protein [Chloroflexota bacterium]
MRYLVVMTALLLVACASGSPAQVAPPPQRQSAQDAYERVSEAAGAFGYVRDGLSFCRDWENGFLAMSASSAKTICMVTGIFGDTITDRELEEMGPASVAAYNFLFRPEIVDRLIRFEEAARNRAISAGRPEVADSTTINGRFVSFRWEYISSQGLTQFMTCVDQ